MRSFLASTCFVSALCAGVAAAQSPVAYVYVGQDAVQTEYSPIYAFAASSDGKLKPLEGSPFTQAENTGIMIGTNGSHFIFAGQGPGDTGANPLDYLYSYEVSSDGAIGQQLSSVDAASYAPAGCITSQQAEADFAVLDHTGQYVYLPHCGASIQTYKIEHSGELVFQSDTIFNAQGEGGPVKIAGNDAYAYTRTEIDSLQHGYPEGLNAFVRKSDGSMDYIGFADITGPNLPPDYFDSFAGLPGNWYFPYAYAIAPLTNDPTNHFAAMLTIEKFTPPDTIANEGCALASFTVGSQGQLTSTNTYDEMPHVCGIGMLLSPSGTVLAVNGGTNLQFFHFDGAKPITKFAQVDGKAGAFSNMAWDGSNHLYVLNALSGALRVYTVSSEKVVEASGSPHDLPYCGVDPQSESPQCPQTLVVRIIPQTSGK